jgi:hypothetical protein
VGIGEQISAEPRLAAPLDSIRAAPSSTAFESMLVAGIVDFIIVVRTPCQLQFWVGKLSLVRSISIDAYIFVGRLDNNIFLTTIHPLFNYFLFPDPSELYPKLSSQKSAMHLITPLVAAALIASNAVAHPGHDMRTEIAERAAFMQTSKRDLSHCAAKMKIRGIEHGNVARRTALAKNARKKRSIAASE